MTENDKTPPMATQPPNGAPPDAPPHDASLQHAMQEAVTAIADVAMAPVEEVLGHATWLRWALVSHLLATLSATIVALHRDFADWQLYAWTGLLTAVLIGNFMRWGPSAGWIHRAWTTLAALIVDAVWMLLLVDRARAGQWHASKQPPLALAPDASLWFWLPVALLLLCAGFLIVHGLLAPHYRLRRIHHSKTSRS